MPLSNKSVEPFNAFADEPDWGATGRSSAPLASEDKQLAWAAQESLKLEETERQRRLQEQRDLELAIALSKQEQASGR